VTSLGVVISASHNPYADNGIKFFSAQGTKLDDAWEQAVEAMPSMQPPVWADSAIHWAVPAGWTTPPVVTLNSARAAFANDLTLKGLKIVVDGAHGAAYHIAPKVSSMNWVPRSRP
jgi:phosphoglucosamine mutase